MRAAFGSKVAAQQVVTLDSHVNIESLTRLPFRPRAWPIEKLCGSLQILSQPGVLTRGQAAKAGVVLDAQVLSYALLSMPLALPLSMDSTCH